MTDMRDEWNPIETVPEGERVLLFDRDWELTVGAIQIGHATDHGGFITSEIGDCEEFNPTHWMPLPDAPDETCSVCGVVLRDGDEIPCDHAPRSNCPLGQ